MKDMGPLTGIPCKHGVAAIYKNLEHPEDYLHDCYLKEAYLDVYSEIIHPMPGQDEWIKMDICLSQPPHVLRPPGRPKKLRRRDPDEPRNPHKVPPRLTISMPIYHSLAFNVVDDPLHHPPSNNHHSTKLQTANPISKINQHAETHKAEISTNPSPVAVATAENGGDGRERRWRVEILNSESGDGREPASVFCDVSDVMGYGFGGFFYLICELDDDRGFDLSELEVVFKVFWRGV
uniref:Uncharacterized protein n=1 Tax=Fagus sylvatica TaxID=28930 RepID=A0A2N9GX06_FAGSY